MNYWVNSPLWRLSSNCYILLFIWQCLLFTDPHWNFQMLIIREEVFWYSPCVNRALTCCRQPLTVVAVAEQECQTFPGFWKITLMPRARMWLVAQLWVTDWAAALRHTVIPSSPYNPSLNSALICASHRGDLSNSRWMVEPALHAAGPAVLLQWIRNCWITADVALHRKWEVLNKRRISSSLARREVTINLSSYQACPQLKNLVGNELGTSAAKGCFLGNSPEGGSPVCIQDSVTVNWTLGASPLIKTVLR